MVAFPDIPQDILPADGRFGCGPSKVRAAQIEALSSPLLMGTSHRATPVRDVVASMKDGLRALLTVPDDYEVVMGNGGASATIQAVLEQLGARVTVISRHGPDNYDNLDRHADARVIVNTTPVGMYPNTGRAAVDLRQFPQCAGVLDIVYNPARTALLLQAESLGIPCAG